MTTIICQEPGCAVVLVTMVRPYRCRAHRRSTCCGNPAHRYQRRPKR